MASKKKETLFTDRNREGVKKFSVKYLNDTEESVKDITDADCDTVLQQLYDDVIGMDIKESEVRRRIKALCTTPDDDFRYSALISALRFCSLYTGMGFVDDVFTFPLLQADNDPDSKIYPMFTRKSLARSGLDEVFELEEDVFEDIIECANECEAETFVINPGTDDCLMVTEEAANCYYNIVAFSDNVTEVMYKGIDGEDLTAFPLLQDLFNLYAVECFLNDGTYLTGVFEKPVNPDSDSFSLLPRDDTASRENVHAEVVKYSDLKMIRYMEEDPSEDPDYETDNGDDYTFTYGDGTDDDGTDDGSTDR